MWAGNPSHQIEIDLFSMRFEAILSFLQQQNFFRSTGFPEPCLLKRALFIQITVCESAVDLNMSCYVLNTQPYIEEVKCNGQSSLLHQSFVMHPHCP